jgi:hypothetical protein
LVFRSREVRRGRWRIILVRRVRGEGRGRGVVRWKEMKEPVVTSVCGFGGRRRLLARWVSRGWIKGIGKEKGGVGGVRTGVLWAE